MANTRTLKARSRRKRWERARTGLLIVFLPMMLVLALGLMPIWAPILAWQMKRDAKRMSAVAGRTLCQRCGHILGPEALERANAHEATRRSMNTNDRTAVRYRHIRVLRAMCVVCGAAYAYDADARGFRLLTADERANLQILAE